MEEIRCICGCPIEYANVKLEVTKSFNKVVVVGLSKCNMCATVIQLEDQHLGLKILKKMFSFSSKEKASFKKEQDKKRNDKDHTRTNNTDRPS